MEDVEKLTVMGGSGKAGGFAQALPMANGQTIGKLRRLRLPLPPDQ